MLEKQLQKYESDSLTFQPKKPRRVDMPLK